VLELSCKLFIPTRGLQEELLNGDDIAKCPSCSLRIRVICDLDELEKKYAPTSEPQATAVVAASS